MANTKKRYKIKIKKSNQHIYAFLYDNLEAKVITSYSTLKLKRANKETSFKVGEEIGKKAKDLKLQDNIYFDRGNSMYHGKVKALADGARSTGANF